MSPFFKFFLWMALCAALLGVGLTHAQSAGNVVISWTYPTIDLEGAAIPSTDSTGKTNAVTDVYVYYGATSGTMTQQADVKAPATSYTATLAPGHYCFSVIAQNAYGVSPFAPAVCADVTATGVTITAAPAAPSGFGAK